MAGIWQRYQRARFLQSRMGTGPGTRHAAIELLHPGEVHPIGAPPVSVRLGSADIEAYVQVFVEHEYDFDYSHTPEVIIDAGAHIGLAATWFARRFPDAMIVALELERSNFELLRTNTASLPNVRSVHAALWPTSGSVAVADPHAATWAFRASPGSDVEALTVTDIMERFEIERVDLLKLDVEGAERDILRASDPWIEDVDMIAAELHDRWVPGCTRAFMAATTKFEYEQWRGENVFVARQHPASARSTNQREQ